MSGKPCYVPFYRNRLLLSCLGVALLVAMWLNHAAGTRAEARLQQRLASYAEQGDPVRLADLDRALPQVPDAANLALHLGPLLEARESYLSTEDARESVRGLPFLDRECETTQVFPESVCRQAELYLAENADWTAVVSQACGYPGFATRAHSEARQFGAICFPYGMAMDHAVSCLCLQAWVHARRGRLEDALETLDKAKNLGRRLLDEPFLARVINSLICDRKVLRAVAALTLSCQADPQAARRLAALTVPLGEEWLLEGLRYERLAGLDYYYARGKKTLDKATAGLSYLSFFPAWVAVGKVNEFLDYMDESMRVLATRNTGRRPVALALERQRDRYGSLRNPLLSLGPPIHGLVYSYDNYVNEAARVRGLVVQWAGAPNGCVARDGGGL